MRLLAPKTKQSYLFLAPLHSGLGKAVVGIYTGRAMQWDALAFLPHPTDITDIAPPPTLASIRFDPPACQAGLTSAGLEAAGPDGCLLGRIHFPCGYVVCYGVCAFVLLRCFSCSHTVLPKEHSLGVIFFLLTFLMFMLYFSSILLAFHYWLYSVWLCMWWIIKNLERTSLKEQISAQRCCKCHAVNVRRAELPCTLSVRHAWENPTLTLRSAGPTALIARVSVSPLWAHR